MTVDTVTPAIRLRAAAKHYKQGDAEIHAVDHVDLEIHTGEFVTLAGPSGSDKTTLLNLIGGLDRPDSGEIYIQGQSTHDKSDAQLTALRLHSVGFVFQAYNLIPVLTARENAEFVLQVQKIPEPERIRIIDELFEALGLAGLAHRYPPQLSGGQQQRVAVARAVASRPAIVLADEPTANLDSESAARLLEVMRRLNRERNVTFLFSAHDPRVIEEADRVIRMRDGKIVADEKRTRS